MRYFAKSRKKTVLNIFKERYRSNKALPSPLIIISGARIRNKCEYAPRFSWRSSVKNIEIIMATK